MSERGIRNNQGKPQWSLIPMRALEPGVRVLEQGSMKYGANNWRKGLFTREICESLLRHVYAYLEGEDNDSESGQPHVGHIIANAIFLSEMHQNRPDMDNRFSKEKTCCGKWDELGSCTCVDNRSGKEKKPKFEFNDTLSPALDKTLEQLRKAIEVRKATEKIVKQYTGGFVQNAKVGSQYPKEKKPIPFRWEDVITREGWKSIYGEYPKSAYDL